jgi:hypothetical protein
VEQKQCVANVSLHNNSRTANDRNVCETENNVLQTCRNTTTAEREGITPNDHRDPTTSTPSSCNLRPTKNTSTTRTEKKKDRENKIIISGGDKKRLYAYKPYTQHTSMTSYDPLIARLATARQGQLNMTGGEAFHTHHHSPACPANDSNSAWRHAVEGVVPVQCGLCIDSLGLYHSPLVPTMHPAGRAPRATAGNEDATTTISGTQSVWTREYMVTRRK